MKKNQNQYGYHTCRLVLEITRKNLECVQNFKNCRTIFWKSEKNFIVANFEYQKNILQTI